MIFPILNGFVFWNKAPVTWTLLFFNLLVLVYTSITGTEAQRGLDELMRKHYFVQTQGRVYAEYLGDFDQQEYPSYLLELGKQIRDGQTDRTEVLGQLAFRDFNFLNKAEQIEFSSDPVAEKIWHKRVGDLRQIQEDHPSYTFGLEAQDPSLGKWVSYIFVHSGWLHFVGNMLFLVIFGAVLEQQIGGVAFLVVFLLSGTVAAGVFALMTGVTSSPLVGASGAISGIMTLYCVLNWRRPERYFYWLFLPFRGFMGFVYLPAWVALILWAINDLSGFLSSVPELGGVAHAAHLGGEMAGLIAGLTVIALRWAMPWTVMQSGIQELSRRSVRMGVLVPFLPPLRRKM